MRLRVFSIVASALVSLASPALAATSAAPTTLRFVRDGEIVRTLEREAIREACAVETVEVDDPYYLRRKRFLACPLATVVRLGFGDPAALAGRDVLFRAADGYEKPSEGRRLGEAGGFVAIADAELSSGDALRFEPIDRRRVDPAPFYVVWTGGRQRQEDGYPWPYQLVEIAIVRFEDRFPHTVPPGAAEDSPAARGFTVFRERCFSCHAINGEGGKIGPDLNVPRSIVEYRPAEQIREFVRDPSSFRYTTMPPHRDLAESDLDALLAYLEAMSRAKHDPGTGGHR